MNETVEFSVGGHTLTRIDGIWYGVPQIGELVAFSEEQGAKLDKAYAEHIASQEDEPDRGNDE